MCQYQTPHLSNQLSLSVITVCPRPGSSNIINICELDGKYFSLPHTSFYFYNLGRQYFHIHGTIIFIFKSYFYSKGISCIEDVLRLITGFISMGKKMFKPHTHTHTKRTKNGKENRYPLHLEQS
ncbi:hypothetical protein KIL84_020070 [Mauremys mutica]|uniref:Uncharacterized protein n=1 Tax=Mauremys mutica TaxID=74926 RepID=A0A9D4BAV7_9SAUR|nr:hypothetical protein KIL84_020070 [Mauremys mutica]